MRIISDTNIMGFIFCLPLNPYWIPPLTGILSFFPLLTCRLYTMLMIWQGWLIPRRAYKIG